MAIKLPTKTLKGMAKQYERMSKGHDFKKPLRASAKMVAGENLKRFDKEVDPNGKGWKPLTKKYEKWKKKQFDGKGSKINVFNGILRTSITSNATAMGIYKLKNDSVTFGSNVDYAGHVQKRRPFLGISEDDIKEIGKLFDLWLEKLYIDESKR